MKTKDAKRYLVLVIGCLLISTACIEEKYFDCYKPLPVLIEAVTKADGSMNSDKKPASSRIYIYDEAENLIEWIDVEKDTLSNKLSTLLHYKNREGIMLYSVNSKENDSLLFPCDDKKAVGFSIVCIDPMNLNPTLFGGNGYFEIETGRGTSSIQTLNTHRLVGCLQVVIRDIRETSPNLRPEDLSIQVERISKRLNARWEGEEEELSVRLAVKADKTSNDFITPYHCLFPSAVDSGLEISLWNGPNKIGSFKTDSQGRKLAVRADEVLRLYIDFTKMEVSISVKPWENEDIDVEI